MNQSIREQHLKEQCSKWQSTNAAVMILGSVIPPPSFGWIFRAPSLVLSQTPAKLSVDDHRILTELGLPREQRDNLNALLALYNKTENYNLFSVQVSRPGMELSRSYILEQIKYILMHSRRKTGNLNFFIRVPPKGLYFFQLFFTTMVIVRRTLVTGVLARSSSPSEILLISTCNTAVVNSSP